MDPLLTLWIRHCTESSDSVVHLCRAIGVVRGGHKTLGGAIFLKLNWISPKSSDLVVHDLCHIYDLCSDCNSPRPECFFLAL